MYELSKENSRVEKIASKSLPNTYFMRAMTLMQATSAPWKQYKTLGPKEVQQLCKEKPRSIAQKLNFGGAYLGLAVSTKKPLAEYIQNDGSLYVQAYYGEIAYSYLGRGQDCPHECRIIKIDAGVLEGAGISLKDLEKENKVLYILTSPLEV